MGLLGSLFSAAADIAKETITETMNQNETEKFIQIMIERDAQNAEANEKLYQDWLAREKNHYFALKNNRAVQDAFIEASESFKKTGKFDFGAIDNLNDELKSGEDYKENATVFVNHYCETLIKLYQEYRISIRFIMQTVHDLQRFSDVVPGIRGLDRHYNEFFPVDKADRSVLTGFNGIKEALESIKKDYDANYVEMIGSSSPLARLAKLPDILKEENYIAALSNLLFSDNDSVPYDDMKKMILGLSMDEMDEANALIHDTYHRIVEDYLRLAVTKEKAGDNNPFLSASTQEILPIDLLISQAILASKAGVTPEFDINLDNFLEYYPLLCTSSWDEQLFTLQRAFAYLKMYPQERKVLEFLVKNNVPRDEQVDRRLNFLKNFDQNSSGTSNSNIEEYAIQTSDNEVAYDYRFVSWTVSDINSYANLLTSEEKTFDLPMVIAEWNKKIPQNNIHWSTDAMLVYLDKYLHENFGNQYISQIKKCGAIISNEVEYEPSVYIEPTSDARYPWISFVVTGEQLTVTQVSFSIYALYLPEQDSQCCQVADVIEKNQKYQNRLVTLKQGQNPKIKNYVESINEILISGLEAWLNSNNTSGMYD